MIRVCGAVGCGLLLGMVCMPLLGWLALELFDQDTLNHV